jgi:cytochrome c-type biogenesis protein CcmE
LTRRSRRLALIAAALAVIGCAVGLGLYAMSDVFRCS